MPFTGILARFVTNYDSRKSIASRLRAKRIAVFLEMVEDVHREFGHVEIIDLGGTETYWNIVPKEYLDARNVRITLVNLPSASTKKDHGPFRFVAADACDLAGFSDKSFHIAHSNSVVEHVGDWGRMIQFANELSRVSQKYYVQTPNYWFPVEPHSMTPFFHWLPRVVRIWLVLHLQLGHWKKAATREGATKLVVSAQLLKKKMLQQLFTDAEVLTERFFWLPKSFMAVKR